MSCRVGIEPQPIRPRTSPSPNPARTLHRDLKSVHVACTSCSIRFFDMHHRRGISGWSRALIWTQRFFLAATPSIAAHCSNRTALARFSAWDTSSERYDPDKFSEVVERCGWTKVHGETYAEEFQPALLILVRKTRTARRGKRSPLP